jgi:hypothetical protein
VPLISSGSQPKIFAKNCVMYSHPRDTAEIGSRSNP